MPRRGDAIFLRGKTWWLDFTHQHKRHQVRLGSNINRTVARELAAVQRAAILRGEAGIGRKPKDMPFEKAAEEFLKWAEVNKRPNTLLSYQRSVNRLQESFGGRSLGEISPFLVEKHKHRRVEEEARIGFNRELTCLKTLYYKMIEWKRYEGENPAVKVKLLEELKNRIRFLDEAEEESLLEACSEPLRTLVLVGIHAGVRLASEALTLRWENVDLNKKTLTVAATYAKNKESRTIPLNSNLQVALEKLRGTSQGQHVFTGPDGKPLKSVTIDFCKACGEAGLRDVTPHTLRHTFGSRLVMAGVDLRTVQELGGWKDLKMVQRYSHLSEPHKAAAVEKLVGHSTTPVTKAQFAG
jgi:integrase